MKDARLNRLFNPKTRRCFDVAVDHGFFNENAFLAGIEDLPRVVETLAAMRPDAIQLTVGQARLLQSLPSRTRPALVLRTDVANVYGTELPQVLFSRMIEEAALQAVRLDAACVVVNLFLIPGRADVTDQCIQNIIRLKAEADHYAMPLMIEPLVFQPNAKAGGYMVDGNPAKIIPLVRQAVELGADIIKADPTDDVTLYHNVIQIAGSVPVLVRGGGRATEREIFQRTRALIDQGAAGIVYGRNIIQHPNPAGMTRALMAVVHDGATADVALGLVQG
jgi:class I fructose-bisphosphate aldolase